MMPYLENQLLLPPKPNFQIPQTLEECHQFIKQWQHDFLTPEELADITKISIRTLSTWRSRQTQKLPYLKIGNNLVRYRRWDIVNWANASLTKIHD